GSTLHVYWVVSRDAASIEEGNSRQNIHSRADRQLFLRRMPVHENEHIGKGLRRVAQHGTGDHFAGIDPPTRRVADSSNARAQPLRRQRRVTGVTSDEIKTHQCCHWSLIARHFFSLVTGQLSLFTPARWSGRRSGSLLSCCCLALCSC